MRIIETQAFQFEELDLPTQEKVINQNRDINTMFDWWDSTYYQFEQCQIKVEAFDIGRRNRCRVSFMKDEVDSALEILNAFGENTEISACARVFLEDRDKLIEKSDDDFLEQEMQLKSTLKFDIEHAVLHYLREDYEWFISDEAVEETIVMNGYEFTKYGERI